MKELTLIPSPILDPQPLVLEIGHLCLPSDNGHTHITSQWGFRSARAVYGVLVAGWEKVLIQSLPSLAGQISTALEEGKRMVKEWERNAQKVKL